MLLESYFLFTKDKVCIHIANRSGDQIRAKCGDGVMIAETSVTYRNLLQPTATYRTATMKWCQTRGGRRGARGERARGEGRRAGWGGTRKGPWENCSWGKYFLSAHWRS